MASSPPGSWLVVGESRGTSGSGAQGARAHLPEGGWNFRTCNVYDTGSTDGTWEIVKEARAGGIVGCGRWAGARCDLRTGCGRWLFDRGCGSGFCDGGWVRAAGCGRVFYHVPPPEFVRGRVARGEGRVYAQVHDFMLTRAEGEGWEEGREQLADRARADRGAAAAVCGAGSFRPRLFRFRRADEVAGGSHGAAVRGRVAAARIPVRALSVAGSGAGGGAVCAAAGACGRRGRTWGRTGGWRIGGSGWRVTKTRGC